MNDDELVLFTFGDIFRNYNSPPPPEWPHKFSGSILLAANLRPAQLTRPMCSSNAKCCFACEFFLNKSHCLCPIEFKWTNKNRKKPWMGPTNLCWPCLWIQSMAQRVLFEICTDHAPSANKWAAGLGACKLSNQMSNNENYQWSGNTSGIHESRRRRRRKEDKLD